LAKTDGNRRTVLEKSLRTGQVLNSVLDYYASRQDKPVRAGFLENVLGLADPPPHSKEGDDPHYEGCSNLDITLDKLKEAGYWAFALNINPKMCMNSKVNRTRIWIPHFLEASVGDIDPALREEVFMTFMNVFMGAVVPFEVEDMLLKNEDELVKTNSDSPSSLSPTQALGRLQKRRKLMTNGKWLNKSQESCEARGENWMGAEFPSLEVMQLFPGLQTLSPRNLDRLACLGVKFPERNTRTIDLSQSEGRSRLTEGSLPCTTPGMDLYVTSLCRLTVGVEAMAFQSIHFGDNHDKLRKYSNKDVADLAGNAFEAIA
jgi:hypothetical protein